jgi:hypothetical protein
VSLARILSATAYVASVTGTDARGNPVYGAPAARAVRVEQQRRMVRNARGEEVASNHRLWCLETIALTDRVWLPGASTSSPENSYAPISVAAAADFAGARTLYRVDL